MESNRFLFLFIKSVTKKSSKEFSKGKNEINDDNKSFDFDSKTNKEMKSRINSKGLTGNSMEKRDD